MMCELGSPQASTAGCTPSGTSSSGSRWTNLDFRPPNRAEDEDREAAANKSEDDPAETPIPGLAAGVGIDAGAAPTRPPVRSKGISRPPGGPDLSGFSGVAGVIVSGDGTPVAGVGPAAG